MKADRLVILSSLALAATALVGEGCGSSNKSATLSIPAVAPIVKAALPAGLKPGASNVVPSREMTERRIADIEAARSADVMAHADVATRSNAATNANGNVAAGYITNLFQVSFNGSDGSSAQGYLMSQVTVIDDRMTLVNGADNTKGCLTNSTQSFTMDMSAIDSATLKFTLQDLQCSAPFQSGTVSPGVDAGEVFGQNGSTTSVWVQPVGTVSTNGAFINAANVTNTGSSNEQVDGVSVSYSVAGTGVLNIVRYTANPGNNSFEMYYGGSQGTLGSASQPYASLLGTGFRMISDGNHIYADGTLCTDISGGSCGTAGNWQSFSVCMNASTLSLDATVSDCNGLANSFQLNNSSATTLTYAAITNNASIALAASTMNPGPSAAAVAAVTPYANISAFSSVTTTYGN